MTLSFAGIENVEFYSGHYLDAVLEGDLKAQFEAWSTAETDHGTRAPWKALESLGNAYFQSRKAASDENDPHARLRLARDFHAKLTEALGYRYAPDLIERDADILQVPERCTVADLMATTEVRWSSPDHPEGRLVPLLGLRYTDPGLEPRKQRIYPTPWTRHSREADYAAAWSHTADSGATK